MYLAAQLFSGCVPRGQTVLHIFSDQYGKEADFIAFVDQAFDTFYSRHVLDGKHHRSAFGLSQTIEDEYSCLLKSPRSSATRVSWAAGACRLFRRAS